MASVVDLLRDRAGIQPTDRAFLFVDGGTDDQWITYSDLDRAARTIAGKLSAYRVTGQPVLLLYPPGRSYVEGFLGCLYAGAIAVPAYPPDPARLGRTLPRLRSLVADCGATVALSLSWLAESAQAMAEQAPELATLQWVSTDDGNAVDEWMPPRIDGGSVALLQYTSGSTGAPKGVMLTHDNLRHNLGLIRDGFSATASDVGMSWLPPYHDMGLIGGVLQPIYTGLPVALMSPLTFLSRPMAWLETVSRLGVTISGGPNFAYDLCVRKSTPEQRRSMDLSRWEVAFCGAEPVRAESLNLFAEAFAEAGFRREAFYPCYGLAEATLIVTGGRRGGGARTSGKGVSLGRVLGDQRLHIVDGEAGQIRPTGVEGEIWLSGPSVAAGYRGRSDTAFSGVLQGDPDRRYLRTGDLGYLDSVGELVVTGRIKDMIIIRGRNIYPQDLEQAAEQIAGVRPGCTAAFGFTDGGQEQVGLACELRPESDADTVAAAVRQALSEVHEISVAVLILLAPGQLPKTSSGKVQRHACREAYLAGRFVAHDPGTALAPGLDSLGATELAHQLQTELGVDVSVSDVLRGATRAELATRPRRDDPVPVPQGIHEEVPATDGQRALWFVQRWAPGSTVYQVSRAARIGSRIDVEALDRALQELVSRHRALRTSLPARNGEPVQRITPTSGPVLNRRDASDVDDVGLRSLVQQEADRVLDIEAGPLWRASLYTRAPDDHVLLLTLHHTITDFWSLSVLVDELIQLYAGASLPPPAPPPVEAPVAPKRLDHWRATLAGAPSSLDLPSPFPRPRLQSFHGATHRFTVEGMDRLGGFARENDLTLFTVLLAGWLATLSRYCGDDIVTGIATSGRDDARFRNSVGYFAQPLPVRARFTAAMTFRDLTAQVRESVLDALEHGVPLARLVEAVQPERDPSRPVLFQTMFVMQAPPSGRPDLTAFAVADESARAKLAGLDVRPLRLGETGSPFDVSLMLAPAGSALTGEASYCADLFDELTVARVIGHFATLVGRAVAEPDAPLDTLDLMDEAERSKVLAFAHGAQTPVPELTLPQLLARQMQWAADRTALVCGETELSYAEMDEAAGRVAATLRNRFGVKPGSVVGVQLPRGIDAVVAFWGVLKAGGTYLPLELGLPPARLEWMLADAEPDAVLTTEAMRQLDPEPLMCTDGDADDTAYLLYTSGSTGRPKGVLIGHRGAVSLGPALAAVVGITAADRVLQYASCAFDAWIAEVLLAHLTGAALVVVPAEAVPPGAHLVELLARQRVTAAIFAPSTLDALPEAELPDLRCVMSAGEACPPDVAQRWGRNRELYNLYGPTEATVCSNGGRITADGRRPPLGGPIPNVLTYVLDSHDRPVPVGVPGELCIGGIGVGKGYVNRPDLTAQQFVPNPFGDGMLYRSGDRVRWLPDGTLDFLGRIDDQVKIRGVRVEPGEVEARLKELLGLREIVVVPRESELVAYLVCPQPRPAVGDLRAMLRAEFSSPWVPAAFVFLDSIPRSVSGKLDRAALPPPSPAARGITAFLAPRTELETAIARVWSELLNRPVVGVRDHFFDELGGTSLLVAKVTSELGRRLHRDVAVTHIFEHPTVEALARRLSGDSATESAETSAGHDVARARRQALAARRGKGI